MNRFSYRLLSVPLFLFLASCMSLGLNFKHKTPKKPARLPDFTQKDSLLGFNNANRSCFDVKHYDIHISIDTDKKSISGKVTTRFDLIKPSDKIQIDLDPQFKIDSIKQGAQRLSFTRKATAITITLPSKEVSQLVTVYYQGKPVSAKRPPWEGGFVWKKDKNGKPFVSVACEGAGAQTWLPVKAWLGDEPDSMTMHLSIPKELVGVSNGNLISVEGKETVKVYTWQTSYMINPYNITFYVGDYKLMEQPYTCMDGEKMTLKFYALSENFTKAETHFLQTEKILKVYEALFGNYPWTKDGYKLVESPFAGMEHQTAIAYGNGYKNERNESYDYIILHETAHEWWGNAVSVADFSDVWIHEGMATYAEALYVEKTKGYEAYLNYVNWNSITVANKKPVIGPSGVYYWNYKDGDPYVKGAAMLHTLRNHLQNDTLFFAILKTFFKEQCYKTTSTKDFINLVNKMSAKDQTYFFDHYLYHRSSPLLLWNFDYDFTLEKDQLIFQFDRVNHDFTTPIEVEQGSHKFFIYPTNEIQFYTLPEGVTSPVKMNMRESYLEDGFKRLEKIKSK
ncbi:hypothetical protein CNR22_24025 [Sphingobacteriaceae bacterium]|nr:hypothetical protein CNR22_24025 [Sphingobacteriaceae bacterium]